MTTQWISQTGYTVQPLDTNVYAAALERIRYLFTLSDTYVVAFSGGKDSTVTLMLSLQVARELGRLPLNVAMIDEEVIDPDTTAYAAEIAKWPDLAFHWFCVRIRHTLRAKGRACWHTWDPAERENWARDLPPGAITDVPGLDDSSSYEDVLRNYWLGEQGRPSMVVVVGVRAEEAFNRRRAVIQGGYIRQDKRFIYGKPIYDWTVQDVWRAIITQGWPHSGFYDKAFTTGKALGQQRVAPWGNVASTRETHLYSQFYPDFWQRATRRLPELRAAARYGETSLFRETLNKPDGWTWQEYTTHLLDSLDPASRAYWTNEINSQLKNWRRKFTLQASVPDEQATLGLSWKKLAQMISKNDRINGGSRDRIT